jgi:glycosyltransferase involved in cell wall biosynthesis
MDRNKSPLVSIAIITYNQKEFLRECIESCLAQDYSNTEIVVADDGSSDGTQDILREYDAKYPGKFILRLSENNQGITKNSNVAHFASTGKYIAWMGGDDLMLPGKISKQVIFMEQNPDCTICYHDMDVFESDSNMSLYVFSKHNPPRQGGLDIYIKHGCFNGACSSMVRANKTPDKGFNELLPVASDWLYWIESLANGGVISYIPEVLSRYRRHSGNITKKSDKIKQNTIDHLNSCNYVLAKYPQYTKNALYRYAMLLRGERHRLPYLKVLTHSVIVNRDLASAFAIFIYLITVFKVKL